MLDNSNTSTIRRGTARICLALKFTTAGNRRIVYCQLACVDFNAGSARNDGIFNGECGVCAACLIDTMTGNRVRSEVAGAI